MIRAVREARGYSHEEFYAGRIERGEQNISMQSLIQIALTLQIEPGELSPPLQELKAPYRKRLQSP